MTNDSYRFVPHSFSYFCLLQLAKFQKKKSSTTEKRSKKKKKKAPPTDTSDNIKPPDHPTDGTNGNGDDVDGTGGRLSDDESIGIDTSSIASTCSDFVNSSHGGLISPVSFDVSIFHPCVACSILKVASVSGCSFDLFSSNIPIWGSLDQGRLATRLPRSEMPVFRFKTEFSFFVSLSIFFPVLIYTF